MDQRENRSNADSIPMWSVNTFQAADAEYRRLPFITPGTVWPTPAVGLMSNFVRFREIENSGIQYVQVQPYGDVQ